MLMLTIKGSVSLVSLKGAHIERPHGSPIRMARTAIPRVLIIAARHHGKNTNKSIYNSNGNTDPSHDRTEKILAIKKNVFLLVVVKG